MKIFNFNAMMLLVAYRYNYWWRTQ